MNNMLTAEEVKSFLDVDQPGFDKFLKEGKLHAYKIGGTYLRFRKEEVLNLKQEFQSGKKSKIPLPWYAKLLDFWRFNNFYILSLLFILVLFLIVVRP